MRIKIDHLEFTMPFAHPEKVRDEFMKLMKWSLYCLLVLLLTAGCTSDKAKKLKIGDKAPGFTAHDLENNVISLEDYKGNPVVLRFWSTDCEFCKVDTPIFNHYFNKYKNDGLKVLYINSTSDEETVRNFVETLEVEFPVILDKDASIAASYQVRVVPQTIIIGPDQIILAAILGGVGEAELKNILGPYLP